VTGLLTRIFIVLFIGALFPLLLLAQDVPIPEVPTQWVTDTAGFLAPGDLERINARLRTYEQQTQHQLLVWIGSTTGEVPIEDWANRAFEKWKVGRKGIDDGLVLFIMAQDRRLRIEVGYGIEPEVPDTLAGRIIQNTIVPRIRAGDNAGAVEAGLEAIANAIGEPLPGATTTPREPIQQEQPLTLGTLIFYGIIALIVLAILGTNPSLATWLLISFLSGGNRRGRGGGGWGGGGWGGGGGGGGGGFSGGGGMSGGGGASGSW